MSQLNKKKKIKTFTTDNWNSISDVFRAPDKEDDSLYQERLNHLEKYIKINPELYYKFYKYRLNGNTIEETSKKLNVDKKIINRFWQKVTRNIPKKLRNNNCITKKRKKIDNETIDKIVELRNQGLSFEKIGKKLKSNRTYVLRLYKSVTGYYPNPKNKKLIYIYKKNNEGKYVVDNIIPNPYFTIKD